MTGPAHNTPPMRVGMVGCGNVSGAYLANAARYPAFRIVACGDIAPERADAMAEAHGIAAMPVADLVADPSLDLIVILTTPGSHESLVRASLGAGKHVYCEKPLALTAHTAAELVDLAREAGLRIGCAPDTFLGPGLTTCRRLIDAGTIGRPIAATATMAYAGPEAWHPDPAFLYQPGAGPLTDMGPYYLTALVELLGPIGRVCANAQQSHDTRTIATGAKAGQHFDVATLTHCAAILEHQCGALTTMVMSFELQSHSMPTLEIYGTEATLSAPDPNTFGGPVRVRSGADEPWVDQPLVSGPTDNARGLGLNDMCRAIASNQPHKASGDRATEVLRIIEAIEASVTLGRSIDLPCQPAESPADP